MVHIVSDLHLHPHQWKSKILPNGRNSRLQDGVNAMLQVVDALSPGDTLIFAGDWYEDQREIPLDAIDATRELVNAIIAKKVTTYILVGNHDQLSRDGKVHSIGLLHRPKDDMWVIDEPEITDGWAFLPFRRPADLPASLGKLNELYEAGNPKKGQKMPLVCHVDMIGGVANSGHLSSKGLRLSDFPEWASPIISGHYHRHQIMGDRFMFVGSPYQMNAGEADDVKVWVSCDGTPRSLEDFTIHEFKGLPRFVEIPAPNWEEMDDAEKQGLVERDFVTVAVPHDRRLASLPEGVTQKPLPKPKIDHSPDAPKAGSIPEALTEWLIRRGRPDLAELGASFL